MTRLLAVFSETGDDDPGQPDEEQTDVPSTPEPDDQPGEKDDFTVDPGDEPSTTNVPYEPPVERPQPVIREPDGTEKPWPVDSERPEEQHDEPSEETRRSVEEPAQEETPEAPGGD